MHTLGVTGSTAALVVLFLACAGATKNVLAAVLSVAAIAVLAFSFQLRWLLAGVSAAGALIGGVAVALALNRAREGSLRILVIVIGLTLTIGLFLRAPR